MIISFAWTTLAVIVREKCETRRDWSAKQIALARKTMESGAPVAAWSKSPRFKGERFGTIRITSITENEFSCDIPDEAWEREGFPLLTQIDATFEKDFGAPDVWRFWRSAPPGTNLQTVVGFEVIEVNEVGNRLLIEAVAIHGPFDLDRSDRMSLDLLRAKMHHEPGWQEI